MKILNYKVIKYLKNGIFKFFFFIKIKILNIDYRLEFLIFILLDLYIIFIIRWIRLREWDKYVII